MANLKGSGVPVRKKTFGIELSLLKVKPVNQIPSVKIQASVGKRITTLARSNFPLL